MNKWIVFLGVIVLLSQTACRKTPIHRALSPAEKFATDSQVFDRFFMGMVFYDPEQDLVIAAHNEDKYFTPASTTKLLTFYTSLQLLGDSIPAIKYEISGDTLWFSGMGDPTFLHPDYKDSTVLEFLRNAPEHLYYVPAAFEDEHYGPGWAWDDYSDYYMPEKSAFPLYGNVLRFYFQNSDTARYLLSPAAMQSFVYSDTVSYPKRYLKRDLTQNAFRFNAIRAPLYERISDVPFITSDTLTVRLLSDTLKTKVELWQGERPFLSKRMLSVPADSVYKRLLTESDNFLAEQLLLMCSAVVSDTLSAKYAIEFSQEFILCDLPDEPIWVDGSGLSRYNMFTPRSMLEVLRKIYNEVPEQKLFDLMPAGGERGTLKNWYAADSPFVFAKTGTLRHNHNICGFIKTKSGKTLLFVIMNNHIPGPSSMAKSEMERLLRIVYESY